MTRCALHIGGTYSSMDRLDLRGAVLNCWRIPRCGQRILKVTPLNWMRPERTSSGRRLRLAPAFSRFSAGEYAAILRRATGALSGSSKAMVAKRPLARAGAHTAGKWAEFRGN